MASASRVEELEKIWSYHLVSEKRPIFEDLLLFLGAESSKISKPPKGSNTMDKDIPSLGDDRQEARYSLYSSSDAASVDDYSSSLILDLTSGHVQNSSLHINEDQNDGSHSENTYHQEDLKPSTSRKVVKSESTGPMSVDLQDRVSVATPRSSRRGSQCSFISRGSVATPRSSRRGSQCSFMSRRSNFTVPEPFVFATAQRASSRLCSRPLGIPENVESCSKRSENGNCCSRSDDSPTTKKKEVQPYSTLKKLSNISSDKIRLGPKQEKKVVDTKQRGQIPHLRETRMPSRLKKSPPTLVTPTILGGNKHLNTLRGIGNISKGLENDKSDDKILDESEPLQSQNMPIDDHVVPSNSKQDKINSGTIVDPSEGSLLKSTNDQICMTEGCHEVGPSNCLTQCNNAKCKAALKRHGDRRFQSKPKKHKGSTSSSISLQEEKHKKEWHDVSVTITPGPNEEVGSLLDMLASFMDEHCDSGVVATEQRSELDRIHIQCAFRVHIESMNYLTFLIKKHLNWIEKQPVGTRIKWKEIRDSRSHCFDFFIGYCLKDMGKPHFQVRIKDVSSGDIERGRMLHAIYGTEDLKHEICLDSQNIFNKAKHFVHYYMKDHIKMNLVDVIASMIRTRRFYPAATWVLPNFSGISNEQSVEAAWRLTIDPGSATVDDVRKVFFGGFKCGYDIEDTKERLDEIDGEGNRRDAEIGPI